MIVPMKKVSLVIMGSKKTAALKLLRKLGLMQIEISEGSGQKLTDLKDQISLLESGIFTLKEKVDKKKKSKVITTDQALETAKSTHRLSEDKKACLAEMATIKAELERIKGWGDIDPQSLSKLAEKGVSLTFYEIPKKDYSSLGDGIKTIPLQKEKSTVKFAVITTGAEGEEEIINSLKNFKFNLPTCSTDELKLALDNVEKRLFEIEQTLAEYASMVDGMKQAMSCLEKEVEFETYLTGMSDENLSEKGETNGSVSYFTGYIEADKLQNIMDVAKENAWALIADDPTEEDNVPTKLHNNKFVSLIYPLTDFLGTVPGYFEYDISAWFLFFILIFFGIIFGDGGYGLLITAVAAIPIIKSLVSKKPIAPTFLLVGLFGLSTIAWGTLTCTWFGLSPEQLPAWLKALSIPVISNVYADKIWTLPWTAEGVGLTTPQNVQILCFTLALMQLTIAHIKCACRNRKSIKILADIGSILQLIGMYYVVLSLVVNPAVFSLGLVIGAIPVGTVAIVMVVIGFVMSFVFANYEGNIIKSILSSLKNIVSVLLGVVNVFSDIVSYIRLWAVGLAGAAISATVNQLASPMLGNFLFMIIAIVLLVFGHGLNMILNVLSVIVHGIRLNTLEFSSHLDMSWSGHKFKPFEE